MDRLTLRMSRARSGSKHLLDLIDSGAPILWSSVKVRDCNDENFILGCCIDKPVRKPIHLAAANRSGQRMPSLRKSVDPLDCLPDVIPELLSKMHPLRAVVANRVFQLVLGG